MINLEHFPTDIKFLFRELIACESSEESHQLGQTVFEKLFAEHPSYMHDNYLASEVIIDIKVSSYFDRDVFLKKYPECKDKKIFPKKKVSKFVTKTVSQEIIETEFPLLVTYQLYDDCKAYFFALIFENSDTPYEGVSFSTYLGRFDDQKHCTKALAHKGIYLINF